MKRDILFLIRGLPPSHYVSGKNIFMESATDDFVRFLGKIDEILPELKLFLLEASSDKLGVVGFRNDFEDETDAVRDAWQRLEGVFDGPAVSEFVTSKQGINTLQG
jgi:hypothetical protein